MQLLTLSFSFLMISVIIISYIIDNREFLSARREEQHKESKLSSIKKNLEESLESNVTYSKRTKVELICRQAGIKLGYGTYKLMCLFTGVLFPILTYILLKNEYLLVVAFFMGMMIPGEIIKFKRNRRMANLDKQVGSFLQMVTERYSNTKDFAKASKDCLEDFKGAEPFYSELRDMIMEMDLGVPVSDAIKNLGIRLGNKYVKRLGDYYALSIQIGTEESRTTLLKQAFYQYEENREITNDLKLAITGPANEAYIMIAFIPVVIIYNSFTNPDYLTFMTTTTIGKIGTTVILAVILGCTWLVNTKISAPIE